MAKKLKRNKSNLKNGSDIVDEKHISKKKDQKQKHGIDKDLKYKKKLAKKSRKFANKLKQMTERDLTNPNIVDVIDIKLKVTPENSGHSVQNKKKSNKPKIDKDQRKRDEYCSNRKGKQEKENAAKITNIKDNVEVKKSNNQKKKKKQKTENGTAELNSLLQKKKQKTQARSSISSPKESSDSRTGKKHHNLDVQKLEKMLAAKSKQINKEKKNAEASSLRERMMTKLRASRFRYLNETLYNSESTESKRYFKDDPDAFKAYHDGYKQQVQQWPLNPLDVVISSVKAMPKEYIIADFGCGEARLAASVGHKVHSFDFASLNDNVTVCDMAHTPLLTNGVHVVVFCLSLMGTNLKDYIVEANRVLKKDGVLKIAEVESRFERVEDFIKVLGEYGFKNTWKDLSHNLFYFLDFKKERDIGNKKNKLSPITLKSCLYKKR